MVKTTSGRKPHGNSTLAKITRPVLKPKARGGAPRSNRNAVSHGRYAAPARALRAELRAQLADLRARAELAIAWVDLVIAERRAERAALPQCVHDGSG